MMERSKQLSDIWEKDFGIEYTKRKLAVHDSEGGRREKFWNDFIKDIADAKSILEIGCNAGMNLEAIYEANNKLTLIGIEPNEYALEIAKEKANGRYEILNNTVFDLPSEMKADLVFTCTVMIHIAPDDLLKAMQSIYNASNKYILTMEYYWPVVKEIEYRGLKNALWKQDFGALWLKHFNIELLETGYLDARDGFDRVTWWLFKK